MVALGVAEERQYYHFASSFFQTRFLRHLCTDSLETLPHNVGSSAIENVASKFSYVPLNEIKEQNPTLAIFSDIASRFCNIIP